MKSVVLSYGVALSLIGLLCCYGEANENFSPRVLVLLKESDNFDKFDNSVGSNFNSVLSPSENYYSHSRHVQLWNKLFDNVQKRINVLGHFLWNVDKFPINSDPYVDRRFKKSISLRKPRNVVDNNNSSTLESALPVPVPTSNVLDKLENITFSINTTDLQNSPNTITDSHSTDLTTLTSTSTGNPKLVETTPLIQQKTLNNSSNNNIIIEKTFSNTSSNQQSCIYCPGKMIFLTGIVLLAFGVTIFIYKKRQGRGSRTFYQVGNICSKHDESPV